MELLKCPTFPSQPVSFLSLSPALTGCSWLVGVLLFLLLLRFVLAFMAFLLCPALSQMSSRATVFTSDASGLKQEVVLTWCQCKSFENGSNPHLNLGLDI